MIGITLGEYNGVGAEIVVKSLHAHPSLCPNVRIFGCPDHFQQTCDALALTLPKLDFCPIGISPHPSPEQRARYVLDILDQATQQAQEKKISALVTSPIDKSIVQLIEKDFSGHTQYLAQRSGVPQTVMVMANNDFRILVGTQHIALRDVHRIYTRPWLGQQLDIAVAGLAKHFDVHYPKIAVLGLNPHAGEIDAQAEEKLWMTKAIEDWQKQMDIHGPFSADSFFGHAKAQGWDLVVCAYHDQALIAAKYNGVHHAINITLGLDYLRTSPGHGVAYDLAGLYKADARSFTKALMVAAGQERT
jgi:4-hydroxythreonine-4-phosphate dehydrogenase